MINFMCFILQIKIMYKYKPIYTKNTDTDTQTEKENEGKTRGISLMINFV